MTATTNAADRNQRYVVTMTFEYPAWDERDGLRYEVSAASKREAVGVARRRAERDGHAVGGRGRYWFRAELNDDQQD
jgi:hypothetical protein